MSLPSNAAASVAVTGPNGYSTQLTSSQTLQLTPGTYTVNANSVGAGSSTYYPAVASQTSTVSISTPASVTVNYSTIIPNNTKVLDSAGMSSLTVSPDGSTITMSTSSAVATSLAAGNVLASAPATAAPNGLLVKILSVSAGGQTVSASVQQATLQDAIQQGNFQFTETLGPGNMAVKSPARKRIQPRRLRDRFLRKYTSSGTGACAGNSNTFQEPFDVPLAEGGGDSLTLTGEEDFCPSFSLAIQISGFQLVSMDATVTAGIHASVGLVDSLQESFNVTSYLTSDGWSPSPSPPLLEASPTVVLIGDIPVVVQPTLTPFVGVSGNASADAYAGITTDSTLTVGVSYANGAWGPVDTSASPTAVSTATSVDGQASLKAFAGLQAGVLLDGIVTPSLSGDGYLQFSASLTENPCWSLDAGLEANVGVNVTILGETLVGWSSSSLNLYSTPVLQAKNICFAPTLTIVNPNMAQAGTSQLTLALTGSNFVPDSMANFNGQPLVTTFLDPSDLTAVVPSSDLAAAGTFPVTVTNPDTPDATSSAVTFTVAGPAVSVSVSPATAQVPATETQQFTAAVTGTSNTAVSWNVNGISGGNSTVGTISATGLYTAPASVPTPPTVTVTATSQAVPSSSGSATVTIGPYKVSNLYSFTSLTDGAAPSAPLIQGSDGLYYGTTQLGGTYGYGTVFKVDSAGNVTPLYEFSDENDGANPVSALVQASNGYFYGTTEWGGSYGKGTIFQVDSNGNLTTLYSFTGGDDGLNPLSGLTQASDGHLYGTTFGGGTYSSGTIYWVDLSGNLTTLYSFTGGTDGDGPDAPLIQANDGDFYGTTQNGGNNSCDIGLGIGCGTVFKIDSAGNLTTLYTFSGGSDGANPDETVVQGNDGNFYGTTLFGGDSSCTVSTYTGCGTVFKIDSTDTFTILHDFSGGADGGVPFSSLIQATDGNFYGTATAGGDSSCSVIASGENFATYIGCGTVFKMDSSGNVDALYSFTGSPNDGSNPFAAILEGSDGYFYGTARWGGSATTSCSYTNNGGCGTFFRVSGPGGPLPQLSALRKREQIPQSRKLAPMSSQKAPDLKTRDVRSSSRSAKPLPLKGSKKRF